jgi:Protein of unknown function (DUF3300)/Chaperone of endosialidase
LRFASCEAAIRDEGEQMKKLATGLTAIALFGVMMFGAPASAQTPTQPATAAAPEQQLLTTEQLDQLVAPIALYPDTLLAEILMASTYPLEVVQADRWAKANKPLKGDALRAAADKQDWDASLKSLVATPSVLAMMSEKLDWTEQLGDTVLAQQADVMDAIQRLRAKAQAQNTLKTTKQQIVTVKQEQNKQVIVIEPATPDAIYVPYYNPAVVYGAWPYPAYPPYYFAAPGYIAGAAIATGLAFGAAYAVGRWAGGGSYWGGGMNWGGNNINVNRPVNINNNVNNWQHNSAHRGGVAYNNTNVQQRFGNNNIRSGSQGRMDFRGRNGQQVLRPGGGGANIANRPNVGGGAGNRPNIGGGAGSRPNIGGGAENRPNIGGGAGNRANIGGGGNRANLGGGGGRAGRDSAFGNMGAGRTANRDAARGRASLGGGGNFAARGGGGRAGGGGFAGGGGRGGGGGFRGGGGGRRSDIRLKHDLTLLGRRDDGLGFYRFSYNGSDKAYVGVIAQEVQKVMPEAVVRGRDGYLRVYYHRLGLTFETYDRWLASGAQVPGVRIVHPAAWAKGAAVDAGDDLGAHQSLKARYQNN